VYDTRHSFVAHDDVVGSVSCGGEAAGGNVGCCMIIHTAVAAAAIASINHSFDCQQPNTARADALRAMADSYYVCIRTRKTLNNQPEEEVVVTLPCNTTRSVRVETAYPQYEEREKKSES